jgi:hypothetical protein
MQISFSVQKKNQHLCGNDFHLKFCHLTIYSSASNGGGLQEGKSMGFNLAGEAKAFLIQL